MCMQCILSHSPTLSVYVKHTHTHTQYPKSHSAEIMLTFHGTNYQQKAAQGSYRSCSNCCHHVQCCQLLKKLNASENECI